MPLFQIVINLLKNPSYILSVLAIANILFILASLMYFAPAYSVINLGGDQTVVGIVFLVSVVTSPSLGAIAGGIVTDKCLGSYTNKKAPLVCFFAYVTFLVFNIPCPLVNTYVLFTVLLWFAIFQQGFIQPIMMGIILNTVSPIQRPTAASLAVLI